eukprot:Pompholyxophrys_punicea_v1_NODE_948_length_1106_cov_1.769743.p2 type:complete len:117 gc:universal NODE_948_length_1106_cov_1.769743:1015-665(-)
MVGAHRKDRRSSQDSAGSAAAGDIRVPTVGTTRRTKASWDSREAVQQARKLPIITTTTTADRIQTEMVTATSQDDLMEHVTFAAYRATAYLIVERRSNKRMPTPQRKLQRSCLRLA